MDIVKKVVDFIPRMDLTGDFTRYTDRSIARFNSRVSSLMNLLEMEQGTHPEYPDMGASNLLLELYNSEGTRATVAVHEIETMAKRFLNLELIIEYSMSQDNPELIQLELVISGIPGKVRFDVINREQKVRVLSPKLIT